MAMRLLILILQRLGLSNYLAMQLEKSQGFFGSRFIGKMMNIGNAELEQLTVQLAEVKSNHHVLEIGFRNGKLLEELCEINHQDKVHGIDISEDLVVQVSKRLKTQLLNKKLVIQPFRRKRTSFG